jgi:predicted DNA-binding transcriptional regulator AlpA
MTAWNKTTDAQIESVLRYGIDPFVRISFVVTATGLSRSTIYRLIASGKFPQPSHPTMFTSVWRLSEVREWLDERERTQPGRIRQR